MPADAAALARALAALGVAVDVEADGALAILVPGTGAAFPGVDLRGAIVRAARDAGFASVAYELAGPVADGPSA